MTESSDRHADANDAARTNRIDAATIDAASGSNAARGTNRGAASDAQHVSKHGAPSTTSPDTAPRPSARLEFLGWLGMALLLAAYAAVSFDLVARDAPLYIGVNVVGAALVAVICAAKRAWPAFALEAAWIVISVPSLWSTGA